MCGRYTLAVQLDLIADRFASVAEFDKLAPRFNIARPTGPVIRITGGLSGIVLISTAVSIFSSNPFTAASLMVANPSAVIVPLRARLSPAS